MRRRVVDRVNEAIAQQRSAIIAGEYPETDAISRIGPLLRQLSEQELMPVSEALRRNLELLGIARDAVAEMRAPPPSSALRTYAADGSVRATRGQSEVMMKR